MQAYGHAAIQAYRHSSMQAHGHAGIQAYGHVGRRMRSVVGWWTGLGLDDLSKSSWMTRRVVSLLQSGSGMHENFRAYKLAVEFSHECEGLRCAKHLRDQLLRASSSVALNLSEGTTYPTPANRLRFYNVAFASLRECQTILDLCRVKRESKLWQLADQLAANLYKLTRKIK